MQVIDKALEIWGLGGAQWELVAERENRVFKLTLEDKVLALRLHRQNFRSSDELRSELQWMAWLKSGGLNVPKPVPALDGAFMHVIEGIQVDVLSWLNGYPIGSTTGGLAVEDRTGVYHSIGREMALMHQLSDKWELPEGFTRWSWDRSGLVGEAPVWGRFWENPALDNTQRDLLLMLREEANAALVSQSDSLDYGLIHADLVRENVMLDGSTVQMIDFDDAGFGYRLFDIATALIKNRNEPDFDALQSALVEGYRSVRPLDLKALDLFMALRAATYVGWNVPRMQEPGAKERNSRFIQTATDLARIYLG